MSSFKEVNAVRYWTYKILPLVYDDSLSYYEVLGKVTKALNELIENNNSLTDYINELILEYINSGEISEVVSDIIGNFILNVKSPPSGVVPAVGDGSVDDTEAFQGCIDWAYKHGGGSVFVPAGKYLVQPLQMRDNVSLFGFDRYTCVMVLKGGADNAMLWDADPGVTGISVCNLTLDGNVAIQVNNINVIELTTKDCLFQNLVLTDGYKLMQLYGRGGHVQIDNVVFDYSVINSLELLHSEYGTLYQVSNVVFNNISELKGEQAINIMCDNVIIDNAHVMASVPVGLRISSNNCRFTGVIQNATVDYENTGNMNTIIINGKSVTENIEGDYNYTGNNHTMVLTGDKVVRGTNGTEVFTGDKTTEVNNYTETITKKKITNAKDYEETTRNKVVKSGSVAEEITGAKTVNANSVTEKITGTKTVNTSSVTEEITGAKTVNADSVTEEITGAKTVNANRVAFNVNDFNMNTVNPVGYKAPQIINDYFSFVPFQNEGQIYQVLVKNGDLDEIGSLYRNVTKLGVVSDGVTDNGEAFNTIATNEKYLYFPAGTYVFDTDVNLEGVSVILHPDAIIKSSVSWGLIDCYICGGQFVASKTAISCTSGRNHITRVKFSITGRMEVGVTVWNGVNEIDNCHFNGNSVAQFGVWSDPDPNPAILYVHNCTFENFWLNAIFSSAVSCVISANYFRKCHIQVEPNGGGMIDIVGKNTQGIAVIMGNTLVEPGGSNCSGIESEHSATVLIIGNNINTLGGLYCIACQGSVMHVENNKLHGETAIWTNSAGNISTKNNWYSANQNIVVNNPYMDGVFIEDRYTAPLLVRGGDYLPVLTIIGENTYLDSATLGAAEHLRYTFDGNVAMRIVVDDTVVYEFMVISATSTIVPIVGTFHDFSVSVRGDTIDLFNGNNAHKFVVYRIS